MRKDISGTGGTGPKFRLPRYALQKSGEINYIHNIPHGDKNSLFLMRKDWMKMLDIRINEKLVYCTWELLTAMKVEIKAKTSNAKTKKEAKIFYSIAGNLSCFLEEIDRHDLSHILKGQSKRKDVLQLA